ncbi:MAG: Preprotein translocase, SecG subunit [Candidatus Wolfebacteria bacterium GW2011_GWA2_42_10]|uniref:Protein-export membrane protein SecG n=2 Tax=Candidatus Wolfeibacteriota TaxID=1752735 RepID=A0A0G1AJ41_9BACT|nr:MAG: Preprotein translocase, SecG subunit [Candidatus Wolfebacteria bacterium GW2011_GWB1_41_12]KKS25293.1 MAG: Preprotein translocase, SecG subunit [Candidatus Wolfebacteria bacterium GW2011_GWA2_42_10]KKT56733.1 MAG: Preprotein translocase, SecG subunit [Candidatus Wolfebacteria bacterium GW2011_GWA1_44_24]
MLISVIQIIVSVVLIVLILLQERSSGLSGVFGGSEGGFYQTRRGLERIIFGATIVLVVILMGLSLFSLLR